MILKKNIFAIACTAAFALASCSDKRTDPAPEPAGPQLTGSPWRLTASYAIALGDTVDLYSFIPACQQDDLYTFLPTQQIMVEENAVTCLDSGITEMTGGHWELQDNDTRIYLSLDSSLNISGNVIEFTNTDLQVQVDTTISGIPAAIFSRFERN